MAAKREFVAILNEIVKAKEDSLVHGCKSD